MKFRYMEAFAQAGENGWNVSALNAAGQQEKMPFINIASPKQELSSTAASKRSASAQKLHLTLNLRLSNLSLRATYAPQGLAKQSPHQQEIATLAASGSLAMTCS